MERNNLAHAVGLVGWGYFFLYINVTLGTVNILPIWVAYLLLGKAIQVLGQAVSSLSLLQPLCVLLGVWEAVLWGLAVFDVSPGYYLFYGVQLVVNVLGIYFHFQLLTDLARIAGKAGLPDEKKLLRLRTVRTVLATAVAVSLQRIDYIFLAVGLAAAGVVVGIWICVVLFGFRKKLEEKPTTPEPEGT